MTLNRVKIHTKYDENGVRYQNIVNGNGFDPDSCQYVNVVGCFIASQDDCIAIKSGRDEEGRSIARPSRHIRISNCVTGNGFGIAIGSEMSGGVSDVHIFDIYSENTFSAISLKSRRGRGGIVENIICENVEQRNDHPDIFDNKWMRGSVNLDLFYGVEKYDDVIEEAVNDGTPVFRNILLRHITSGTNAGRGLYINGLPESNIENVVIENVKIKSSRGSRINNVRNLTAAKSAIE